MISLFTKLELEVLETLWREGCALTKKQIIERTVNPSWKPNSCDYILKSLMEKGAVEEADFVKSSTRHYSRTFRPLLSREDYAAMHLSQVMPDVTFAGIFSAMAGKGKISKETIAELKQMIQQLEQSEQTEAGEK